MTKETPIACSLVASDLEQRQAGIAEIGAMFAELFGQAGAGVAK